MLEATPRWAHRPGHRLRACRVVAVLPQQEAIPRLVVLLADYGTSRRCSARANPQDKQPRLVGVGPLGFAHRGAKGGNPRLSGALPDNGCRELRRRNRRHTDDKCMLHWWRKR